MKPKASKEISDTGTKQSGSVPIGKLILQELETIKEQQRNTNIDLFHIKLDLFNIMERIDGLTTDISGLADRRPSL